MHSSLWLIPATDTHSFTKCMTELITTTIPSNFPRAPKHPFIPHLTLTSDIDPSKTYTSNPQSWLDNLSLPASFRKEHTEATIELEAIEPADQFFRKLTMRARRDANLLKLAATVRAQACGVAEADAEIWAEGDYKPHMSLFYGEVPTADVKAKVPLVESQVGWEFGSLFDCCGGTLCMGARLVLVDTSREVGEWEVIASRELDWVKWTMARSLI